MRKALQSALAYIFYPIANRVPLNNWNYWGGRIYNVKLPGKVKPFESPTSGCSANINIIMYLITKTDHLKGDVAECGVFQGATLVPLTFMMNKFHDYREVFGFDSFEGFGDAVQIESDSDSTGHIDLETNMFKETSLALIQEKILLTHTNTKHLNLVKGFFEKSLSAYNSHSYSFVHLDCDLASSYVTCLDFFYSRLNIGGVILFDEYLDPIYTDATAAIDLFFSTRPEKVIRIERDNYVKYYIQKL